VETNPPRNNRLRLIHTDEQPGAGIQLAPGPRQFHRAERSPCLRKLREAPTDTKLFLDKTDSRSKLGTGEVSSHFIAQGYFNRESEGNEM